MNGNVCEITLEEVGRMLNWVNKKSACWKQLRVGDDETWPMDRFQSYVHSIHIYIYKLVLSTLLKTNITFENRPDPKRKHSLSTFNHHFFTGYVSVRECNAHHNLSRIEWCHSICLPFFFGCVMLCPCSRKQVQFTLTSLERWLQSTTRWAQKTRKKHWSYKRPLFKWPYTG